MPIKRTGKYVAEDPYGYYPGDGGRQRDVEVTDWGSVRFPMGSSEARSDRNQGTIVHPVVVGQASQPERREPRSGGDISQDRTIGGDDPVFVAQRLEEIQMAIDWGSVIVDVAGEIWGPEPGPVLTPTQPFIGPTQQVTATGGSSGQHPGHAQWELRNGRWVRKRRRRRRRLLTASDLGDLAQLAALVGKGSDAMRVAVMKAVRRG